MLNYRSKRELSSRRRQYGNSKCLVSCAERICVRGDAYLICSNAELAKARFLLSSTAAPVSTKNYWNATQDTTKDAGMRVTSQLRGLNLCRFLLEVVHILLPLARLMPNVTSGWNTGDGNGSYGPSTIQTQFCDAVAILLGCSFRGLQVGSYHCFVLHMRKIALLRLGEATL